VSLFPIGFSIAAIYPFLLSYAPENIPFIPGTPIALLRKGASLFSGTRLNNFLECTLLFS
jgi:hypothetical protein